VLRGLAARGEQVLDLEALARHKGSSFGALGEAPQPTVEQFENDLAEAMRPLDPARRVWVEYESRSIGRVYLPEGLWRAMKHAPLVSLELPLEARLAVLDADYADADRDAVRAAFQRLAKRLGGLALREALEAVDRGDTQTAAAIALQYYDKTYAYGLAEHGSANVRRLAFAHFDVDEIVGKLLAI
jgi:tRNA 2-selenouridine synthase